MEENNFIIINKKGGAGKTTTATQFLPFVFLDKSKKNKINISLIDSANDNAFSTSENDFIHISNVIKTINKNVLVNFVEDLEMESMMSENNIKNIIDVGGGQDSVSLIDVLSETSFIEDSVVIIPFFLNSEYSIVAEKTVADIRKINKNIKIILLANKVSDDDEKIAEYKNIDLLSFVEEKFFSFVGGDKKRADKNLKFSYLLDYQYLLNKMEKNNILLNDFKALDDDKFSDSIKALKKTFISELKTSEKSDSNEEEIKRVFKLNKNKLLLRNEIHKKFIEERPFFMNMLKD